MKRNLLLVALMSFFLFGHFKSYSQKMPFQGRLMENGVPVNDTLPIVFSIQDLSWTETHVNVNIQNGLYNVVIGSVNPLPDHIFDQADERILEISVDGTALSPVKIYPSLSKSDTRYEKVLGSTAVKDTARYTKVSGGGNTDYNYANYTEASTNAGNIASYGKSVSQAETTQGQYAFYGNASGDGSGSHIGVLGNAAGSIAKFNFGLYGLAQGPGDGVTGLENGSYNNGVKGLATNNKWGNAGVFGHAYGSQRVDNLGVVGWSSVNTGSDTTVNNGVLGWAKGIGINKGVVGLATGGVENWAGWFDGNVQVHGDINASGTITATTVTETSDRRYKEKIETLVDPLANLLSMRGVSYYWKDKSKSPERQIGLIAQEVEEVYPEFVHTNQEGYRRDISR